MKFSPIVCCLAAVALCTGAVAAETQRPNILFILTDDQPQICMGCMGNEHIQTPNMDRLAADGVLFTNAFVTTAICCSNRACILTGQHMRRHGIRDFQAPLLGAHGLVGKWLMYEESTGDRSIDIARPPTHEDRDGPSC